MTNDREIREEFNKCFKNMVGHSLYTYKDPYEYGQGMVRYEDKDVEDMAETFFDLLVEKGIISVEDYIKNKNIKKFDL